MEPAGFAVGVVKLAGLFSSCLEAIDKVQSYRSARADADVQDTIFNLARARFEQWGRGVGIDQGRLLDDHHHALGNGGISTAVRGLLRFIIKLICDQAWASWGKEEHAERISLFENLVQELHNLVPPRTAQGARQKRNPDLRLTDTHTDVLAETRREIHSWLGQRLPNDRYHDSLQRRLVGTGDWIFSRPAFTRWLSPEPDTNAKLLWINGPPGCGKTILCARIVEHLSSTPQTPVAHYFSDLETRDDPFSIIRAWISQIVSRHDDAFEYVRQRWEADSDPVLTRATTLVIFKRLFHIVPDCICVADGLEKCVSSDKGNTSLTAFFRFVADAISGTNTRILLVSRDEQKIRSAVTDNALDSITEYKISPDDVRPDTTAVAQEIVDRKLPNKGDDVRSTLSKAMAIRCEGRFLWLMMQEPTLRKGMNFKQLQQTINHSPAGLNHL
ncbi:ankyrin repeat domain-containing protein 52 [Colletotrichum tofieldiae]|nr:ankyrin repeat domain-containing protein 52 [Colletotrichum tofieldiae]GKT68871.1 ankyrin repeat domain-containing protein 52 [Colletotrichum tofieldiae]